MPAAFKRRGKPDLHNFERHFERDQPLAKAQDVGVVMLARKTGALQVPTNRAADAPHLVGDNGFTIARTAQDNAALALATDRPEWRESSALRGLRALPVAF